ncbi:hypothetical protein GUJ93_ZPchr0005g15417 [Zizania palustris]|uniref:acetylserotonin O-methyltransferase n=1 Tax=Zizania palustris TaxID=103762 RepID=A0A8J5SAJ1_ZIZPA|nr:hypothetical protein GUJ93_ZPchr0005g15417 [Zizania palustris]
MALAQSNGLLDAQLELYRNATAMIKSMALKSALDLRIANAIDHHGGAATLAQVAAELTLHPSKIPCMRRLMRTLAVCGVFTVQHSAVSAADEPVYTLTPLSRLLVGSSNLVPITSMLLHPAFVSPLLEIGKWFQNELPPDQCSIFKQKHGESIWERAGHDTAFDALFNDAMFSDSNFIMDIAIKEHGEVFKGISSLVDVAGGLGGAAQAISKAFPEIKCSVLDLGHVVSKAPSGTLVEYVAGDMFEAIPSANAIFLKYVLHDWSHEKCVEILKNCRKAIPSRDDGGKVIIIDIVVGAGTSDQKKRELQALFDICLMFVSNGIEREEQKWNKVFLEAGFSSYKIIPDLGYMSIIEVYP